MTFMPRDKELLERDDQILTQNNKVCTNDDDILSVEQMEKRLVVFSQASKEKDARNQKE